MMRFSIILGVLPILALSCKAGYDLIFDGQCTNRTGAYEPYDDARRRCESQGDYLLMLRTETDVNQFRGFLPNVWLGLKCDGEKYIWDDGSIANYTNFKTNEVCNAASKDNHYWVDASGYWNSDTSGLSMNTVCHDPLKSWVCDTYSLLQLGKSDDTCFYFATLFANLPSAQAFCEFQIAHIAPIHDQTFNDYLKRTAIANGLTGGMHIGLQYFNGRYLWNDGSELDYSNFAPGFPNLAYGECVAMGTGLFPGQWINVDCSRLLPFACTKAPNSIDETVAPATCPDDNTFLPGEEVASPNWGSSTGSAFCQYALLEPDTSKKVSVEITLFESNMCCDGLKIYDGLFGYDVLLSINGYYGPISLNITASSNTMRMEWNATSGAHVRGWHAKVHSG